VFGTRPSRFKKTLVRFLYDIENVAGSLRIGILLNGLKYRKDKRNQLKRTKVIATLSIKLFLVDNFPKRCNVHNIAALIVHRLRLENSDLQMPKAFTIDQTIQLTEFFDKMMLPVRRAIKKPRFLPVFYMLRKICEVKHFTVYLEYYKTKELSRPSARIDFCDKVWDEAYASLHN